MMSRVIGKRVGKNFIPASSKSFPMASFCLLAFRLLPIMNAAIVSKGLFRVVSANRCPSEPMASPRCRCERWLSHITSLASAAPLPPIPLLPLLPLTTPLPSRMKRVECLLRHCWLVAPRTWTGGGRLPDGRRDVGGPFALPAFPTSLLPPPAAFTRAALFGSQAVIRPMYSALRLFVRYVMCWEGGSALSRGLTNEWPWQCTKYHMPMSLTPLRHFCELPFDSAESRLIDIDITCAFASLCRSGLCNDSRTNFWFTTAGEVHCPLPGDAAATSSCSFSFSSSRS